MGKRTDYIQRAEQFIRAIAPYLAHCSTVDDYENATNAYNKEHHRYVHVEHGSTRVCFITSDYCVKIDYGNQQFRYGGCAEEVRFYQFAVDEGYDYLFAPITRFVYCSHEYFIMPRVYGIGDGDDDVNYLVSDDEQAWLDEHLFDLHYENYGFDENHNPIIIDYACIRNPI